MAAKFLKNFVMFTVFISLSGCNDHINVEEKVKTTGRQKMTLANKHSGYTAGKKQWVDFLSCWYNAGRTRHHEWQKIYPDFPYLSILGKQAQDSINTPSEEDVAVAIANLETSLGDSLPQSYKDFLLAYRPPFLKPDAESGGSAQVGMFAPSQVRRLIELEPLLFDLSKKYPIETPDSEYFVYGTKQDDITGRTRYIKDAIAIGKYGSAMHEFIILYPQNRTSDGEMEAALLFHSGEFRAPSFAELMRQLSIQETKAVDHVAPYPQAMLKDTCADKLPLVNVWWE